MIITERTRVFDILQEYGDIAGVMVMFGVKPVGKYSVRRVPLDEFLDKLRQAADIKTAQ